MDQSAQSIQVLLVDGDAADAATLRDRLCEANCHEYAVCAAPGADDAIHRAASDGFDIILVNWPGLSGRADSPLVETLRARAPETPIIILAAEDDESAAVRLLRAGVQDVVLKSQIAPRALARVIRHAIERHRAETSLRMREILYQGEQDKQLSRLRGLHTIDMAITGSMDLKLTLNIVLGQILSLLEMDAANVLLYRPESDKLECAARRGFRTEALQMTRLALGEGFAGQAARDRRALFIHDLQNSKAWLERAPRLKSEGFYFYAAAPLIAKGQIQGALEIFKRAPFTPDPGWVDFLEALALQTALAINNASLYNRLQKSRDEIEEAYDKTLEGWSLALEMRDRVTRGHTLRVTALTVDMACKHGIQGEELTHLRRGALLHDIGKIAIPDHILRKPGPLDEAERAIMRKHPIYAKEMLEDIAFLRPAVDIPAYHHEKWDGSGYPFGKRQLEIPLAARIFIVADVWDALTSDRPYRKAWPPEQALDHILAQSGAHFDPEIVDLFADRTTV